LRASRKKARVDVGESAVVAATAFRPADGPPQRSAVESYPECFTGNWRIVNEYMRVRAAREGSTAKKLMIDDFAAGG